MAYHTKLPIVTDGLVLYYDAANTKSYVSGDTQMNNLVKDSPFQGTITNGATFDDVNKGILFDGTNQDIELTNPSQFDIGNNITIMMGVTPYDLSSDAVLFSPTGTDTDKYFRIGNPTNSNRLELKTVISNNNPGGIGTESTTSILTGVSYNLGGTLLTDGGNTIGSIYVNGKLESTEDLGFVSSDWDTTLPTVWQGGKVNIMSRPFTSDERFCNGLLHYILVYNRALTDAEMYQNYSSLRGRFI
jgi:hypothetical protein